MFASLLPKSVPFFEMLLEQNKLLAACSHTILELCNNYDKRHEVLYSLALRENEGDKLQRRIARSLAQTFITPIDREDILHISQKQEECIDQLLSIGKRLTASDFSHILFPARKIVETMQEMVALTNVMLEGLAKRHDVHKTRVFRNIREECDTLVGVGVAEVIESPVDRGSMIHAIKWMQIYDRLELLLSKVSDLADDIEGAVLKNA